MEKSKTGVVYIIHAPITGLIKIGHCVNVPVAVRATRNEIGIDVELFYHSAPVHECCSLYNKVCEHFKDGRTYGSWFKQPASKVSEYIKEQSTVYTIDSIYKMYIDKIPMLDIQNKHNISKQCIYVKLKGWNIIKEKSTVKTIDRKKSIVKSIDKKAESTVISIDLKEESIVKTIDRKEPVKETPQPIVIGGSLSPDAIAEMARKAKEKVEAKKAKVKPQPPEQVNMDL